MLLHQEITQKVIDSFFISYNQLGFGFSEAIYAAALRHELVKAGLRVDTQMNVYVHYDGVIIGLVRLDMIVEEKVVVETKTMRALPEDAEDQVFNEGTIAPFVRGT